MSEDIGRTERTARKFLANAVAGIATVFLGFLLAPVATLICGMFYFVWIATVVAGFASLALSVHLLLDAALFRLVSSHDDEATGLAAIDMVLQRTGLKKADGDTRPLTARISGADRILLRQRAALAVFVALFVLPLSLPVAPC
jgi:hypothetical protein